MHSTKAFKMTDKLKTETLITQVVTNKKRKKKRVCKATKRANHQLIEIHHGQGVITQG